MCMGNFTTRGEWADPDYSSCEFTETTWRLCDAVQVGDIIKPLNVPVVEL